MKRIVGILGLLLIPIVGLCEGEPVFNSGESFTLRIAGVPSEDIGVISANYGIDDEGNVHLPHLEPVSARALTPSKLARKIEQAYKEAGIFTNPTVNVRPDSIDPTRAHTISVLGEVKSAGRVPFTPNMTILDVIAESGGFSDWADNREVILVRNGKRTSHNLSVVGTKEDVILKPGDQVVIREKRGIIRRRRGGEE